MTIEQRQRFWDKVIKTDGACWIWTAAKTKGYGQFKLAGKMYAAHRVAWIIEHGNIPKGMLVCHTCDNPPCVNPAHLFLGTIADNHKDCKDKGRKACGERHGQSVLTENDVRSIRAEYATGAFRQSDLANKYGVTQRVICLVCRREGWRHV